MGKKEKILFYIVIINILFMIIATIIIYINLSKPYLIDEKSSSTTIIDFYRTSLYWLALPALSCVILVASIKQKWACIFSCFLSFSFAIVVALGPVLISVIDSLSGPWIGTSGQTTGSGYIILQQMASISISLCFIRCIIAIFQHKISKDKRVFEILQTKRTKNNITQTDDDNNCK